MPFFNTKIESILQVKPAQESSCNTTIQNVIINSPSYWVATQLSLSNLGPQAKLAENHCSKVTCIQAELIGHCVETSTILIHDSNGQQ